MPRYFLLAEWQKARSEDIDGTGRPPGVAKIGARGWQRRNRCWAGTQAKCVAELTRGRGDHDPRLQRVRGSGVAISIAHESRSSDACGTQRA